MRVDQLRDLLALGLEPEKFKAVVEIMSRRSPGAIKQARYRNKKASRVTVTRYDEYKKESKKENKKPAAKARRHPMSGDWQPSQHAVDHLLSKGFERDFISHHVERLRNWALAKGETSTNWDLNLYNWMSRQKEWGGNASGTNGQLTDQERYTRALEAFRSGKAI